LFRDQVRLRERERAAARGDYNWFFRSHFQPQIDTDETQMKRTRIFSGLCGHGF
jgi:hypothetical protein